MSTNLDKKNEVYERLAQRVFDPSETLKVLQHPKEIYWTWGVEKLVNYYDKGLILLVNGHHHKGVVYIVLAWNDTYSYYLLNNDLSIKKEQHEVYFDQLQELIDTDIEKIEDYEF